jgi:hypothetical protein
MSDLNKQTEPKIWFKFEDNEYQASMDAYYKNKYVELPDGRLLGVRMWLESYPPQMSGIHVVEDTEKNRANSVKAELNNPQPALDPVEMINEIGFSFENKKYTTSIDAYPGKYVELPDGRLLGVRMWLESYPPQMSGIHVVEGTEVNRANSVKATLDELSHTETAHHHKLK